MALAVAFVLATGSVVVAECMDKCLHTPYDVQRYLNIPVYAALPAADDEASQRAKPQ
jgi:capsular polysaccharide biosynthesis protein